MCEVRLAASRLRADEQPLSPGRGRLDEGAHAGQQRLALRAPAPRRTGRLHPEPDGLSPAAPAKGEIMEGTCIITRNLTPLLAFATPVQNSERKWSRADGG